MAIGYPLGEVVMFKALLVSILINSEGQTVEKTWAAFLDLDECRTFIGITNDVIRKDRTGDVMKFACRPVSQRK